MKLSLCEEIESKDPNENSAPCRRVGRKRAKQCREVKLMSLYGLAEPPCQGENGERPANYSVWKVKPECALHSKHQAQEK